MAIPTYTPGYPPDGSSLGQTKATIRNNLDGTFLTLAVDHINNNGAPGSRPAGYHNVIHMVPQGSNPAPVTGYGQLFSKSINSVITDDALFWETGTGLIQQLTSNVVPLPATNGYTFLPGGILIQWGLVNAPTFTGTVTFNIPFPANVFNVQTTLVAKAGGTSASNTVAPISGTITQSGFQYNFTGSSSYVAFYWFAIGN
jgi:hypothetical protein